MLNVRNYFELYITCPNCHANTCVEENNKVESVNSINKRQFVSRYRCVICDIQFTGETGNDKAVRAGYKDFKHGILKPLIII